MTQISIVVFYGKNSPTYLKLFANFIHQKKNTNNYCKNIKVAHNTFAYVKCDEIELTQGRNNHFNNALSIKEISKSL